MQSMPICHLEPVRAGGRHGEQQGGQGLVDLQAQRAHSRAECGEVLDRQAQPLQEVEEGEDAVLRERGRCDL